MNLPTCTTFALMILRIDPQDWIAGVKDAYAGLRPRPDSEAGNSRAYASGRVEGEELRFKHRREFEQLLFSGRQIRPLPPAEPSHD